MTQEFNVGDLVTFHPYEKAIPAKVLEIVQYPNDDRVFYKLTGTSPKLPLVSTASGNCIAESRYYGSSHE